jgi:predicted translin family RNA/ssDNA-binding protein
MAKINLENMRKEMEKYDKVREEVIREGRKIIKTSKTAIGAAHRDELEKAENALLIMKSDLGKLKDKVKKSPRLMHEGIFRVAIQEYVEALSLVEFIKTGKLIPYSEEYVDPENYLMGLCDLSGELVRKAINSSIKEDYGMAVKIRKILEELYIEMSKFELRNGELRRKYDGIKYDMKKLDDLVFQLKMKDKI